MLNIQDLVADKHFIQCAICIFFIQTLLFQRYFFIVLSHADLLTDALFFRRILTVAMNSIYDAQESSSGDNVLRNHVNIKTMIFITLKNEHH